MLQDTDYVAAHTTEPITEMKFEEAKSRGIGFKTKWSLRLFGVLFLVGLVFIVSTFSDKDCPSMN